MVSGELLAACGVPLRLPGERLEGSSICDLTDLKKDPRFSTSKNRAEFVQVGAKTSRRQNMVGAKAHGA
jgi:hypothetical protein